jgi:hypothetical protein
VCSVDAALNDVMRVNSNEVLAKLRTAVIPVHIIVILSLAFMDDHKTSTAGILFSAAVTT